MRNQGVSLVSLIITIIVTIILAAIVIFSGMDTPERAQLATFGNNVTNVSSAMTDQLTGVSTNFATQSKTRNTEQIYFTLATGYDNGQFGAMIGDDPAAAEITNNTYNVDNMDSGDLDKNCQRIIPAHAEAKSKDGGLGYVLPKVRESNEAWYVTEEGQVFNATGFVSGGNTYFTADVYYSGELAMNASSLANHYEARAFQIAAAIIDGQKGAIELSGEALNK